MQHFPKKQHFSPPDTHTLFRSACSKLKTVECQKEIFLLSSTQVGSGAILPIRWMPLEAIIHGKFMVASDVHSYGVVMWEIFSYALKPFKGYSNEEVVDFIKKVNKNISDCDDFIQY